MYVASSEAGGAIEVVADWRDTSHFMSFKGMRAKPIS